MSPNGSLRASKKAIRSWRSFPPWARRPTSSWVLRPQSTPIRQRARWTAYSRRANRSRCRFWPWPSKRAAIALCRSRGARPASSPTKRTTRRRSSASTASASSTRLTKDISRSLPASKASTRTATSRRSGAAGRIRRPWPWHGASRQMSARSIRTSTASTRRIRAFAHMPASSTRSATMTCSRWPDPVRACFKCAPSSWHASSTLSFTRVRRSPTRKAPMSRRAAT